jgi:hypothetical protein
MKDEHDRFTAELHHLPQRAGGYGCAEAQTCPPAARPLVVDERSSKSKLPACAKLVPNAGGSGYSQIYVPLAFVAKDWGVSTRRIRFLLAAGRLDGRKLDNGYWEVRYPYMYSFGVRGRDLKRRSRPERKSE